MAVSSSTALTQLQSINIFTNGFLCNATHERQWPSFPFKSFRDFYLHTGEIRRYLSLEDSGAIKRTKMIRGPQPRYSIQILLESPRL